MVTKHGNGILTDEIERLKHMKTQDQNIKLSQEKIDFLIQAAFLMENMANSLTPLDEGYEKLIKLVEQEKNA